MSDVRGKTQDKKQLVKLELFPYPSYNLKSLLNLCDKLMIRSVRQVYIYPNFNVLIFCVHETINNNTIFNTKYCFCGTNEDDWRER